MLILGCQTDLSEHSLGSCVSLLETGLTEVESIPRPLLRVPRAINWVRPALITPDPTVHLHSSQSNSVITNHSSARYMSPEKVYTYSGVCSCSADGSLLCTCFCCCVYMWGVVTTSSASDACGLAFAGGELGGELGGDGIL